MVTERLLAGGLAPMRVADSREFAVRHLSGGGALLLTGFGALGASFLVPAGLLTGLPAVTLFVSGLIMGSIGATRMGLSAAHLWRYADRRALWVPLSACGFGLSAGVAAFSVLGILTAFGPVVPAAGFLAGLAGASVFAVLLSVLTVSALIRWARPV